MNLTIQSRSWLAAGVFAAAVGISARAAAQTAPFELVGGHPVIAVSVNGRGPYKFILDTGAQGNVLRPDIIRDLQLEQIGEARIASPAGPSGGQAAPLVKIDRVSVGAIEVHDIRAVGLQLQPELAVDGVLGPGPFAGRLLTIDYPRRRISVGDGALPAADNSTVFQYAETDPLPVVPVTLADATIQLHLDTGSSGGVTLPIERAKEVRLTAEPVASRTGRTIDAQIQFYDASVDGPVALGKFALDRSIQFATRAPRGRIGGAALKEFAVTLDLANRRVRIARDGATELPSGVAAPPPAVRPSPAASASGPAQQRPEPDGGTLQLPPGGIDVPLRLEGGRALVDVKVNGQGPYTFVVDTGAGGQARADTSLVNGLKLETIGEARGAAGTGGQAVAMPVVRFDALEIGGAIAKNVQAPSRDYNQGRTPHVDGILALGLFKDYLLTLDFERGRLRVTSGTLPEPDGREVFALAPQRSIAEIRITVADQEIAADIDTGGMGGLMLPEALASKLPLASPPAAAGRVGTVSGVMDITAAPLKGDVTIGRHVIANPRIGFWPASRANVGIELLRAFALTFDQRSRRLRLARAASGPIRLDGQRAPNRAQAAGARDE